MVYYGRVECRAVVEEGLGETAVSGRRKVRDSRLYKYRGYTSFENYCREVWGWSRRYTDNQIQSANTTELIESENHGSQKSNGSHSNLNERQARKLAPLKDDQEAIRYHREYDGADRK